MGFKEVLARVNPRNIKSITALRNREAPLRGEGLLVKEGPSINGLPWIMVPTMVHLPIRRESKRRNKFRKKKREEKEEEGKKRLSQFLTGSEMEKKEQGHLLCTFMCNNVGVWRGMWFIFFGRWPCRELICKTWDIQ